MKRKLSAFVIICSVITLGLSCDRQKETDTSTSGLTTMVCDQTFENIMNQEIEVFEFTYPKASIMSYYADEKSAIDSLINKKTGLIVTAHELTKQQMEYLKGQNRNPRSQRLAVDAIALIVNKENNIDELSISELSDILTGVTPKWGDVFPSKLGAIQIVFDNQGSSTVKYMRDSVMNGKEFSKEVYACKNSEEVFAQVKKRKNAIGIIGVSWITADMKSETTTVKDRVANLEKNDTAAIEFSNNVKVLKIRRNDSPNAVKPYQAYIYDGSYPLYRSIYVITTSPNGSLAHGFYSFLTGFIGQKIILNTGVLPAMVQPRMVQLN